MSYATPRGVMRIDNFDINGTGVKKVIAVLSTMTVHKWGVYFVNGSSDAGGATLKLQSLVNNTATDQAVMTIPASSQANKLLYNETMTPFVVQAGGAIQLNVTAEGVTALTVDVIIEYSLLESKVADSANVAQTSSVTS